MRTIRLGSLLCALLPALSPLPAWAADAGWSGRLAAGVGARPDYLGSKDMELAPYFAGNLTYGRYFLEVQGKEISLGMSLASGLSLGVIADIESGRDDSVKNDRVALLPEIDDAFQAGVFAAYAWKGVFGRADSLTLDASYLADVSDTHDGSIGSLGLAYGRKLGDRWSVGGGVRLTYVDEDYAQTYFGISPAAAAASGLPAHDAGGGIRDVGLFAKVGYALDENWSIQVLGSYKQLLGDFKDSPVVDQEGRASQFSGAVALGYRF